VDRHQWDERYSGDDLVWTSTPNQFLVSEVVDLPPGRAVDLACARAAMQCGLPSRAGR